MASAVTSFAVARVLAVAAGAVLAVTGCAGSSGASRTAATTSPTRPSTSSTTPAPGAPTAAELEHALLAKRGAPRPTAASCRPATAAERRHGPFGASVLSQFACLMTVNAARAHYDVQVQPNGCFVAERRRPGQAIYGCGVKLG